LQPSDNGAVFTRERILTAVLALLTLLVVYVNYRIVEPFVPAIAFALALAVATRVPYVWLLDRVGRRDTVAAAVAVVLVSILIIAPAALLTTYVVQSAIDNIDQLQTGVGIAGMRSKLEAQPWFGGWIRELANRFQIDEQLGNVGKAVASRATRILSGSVNFITQLGVTLFVLFFLYRDREDAVGALRNMLPLSNREADRLFSRVGDSINATVTGSLTVALVQATLAGIVYLILGVPGAVLWAAATFIMALVPVLGTFLVWSPIALYLAMSGHTGKAIFLLIWGMAVVGSVDNLLYPYLVGGKLRLHTVPTFFSVVGGIALFGPAGIIMGPMAVAIGIALLDVWFRRTEHGQPAEQAAAEDQPDRQARPGKVLQDRGTGLS
jgi:predicted PurR-regulated permease PerM